MNGSIEQNRSMRGAPITNTADMVLVGITLRNGEKVPFDPNKIYTSLMWALTGYENLISISLIMEEVMRTIYDGITSAEINEALLLATTAFIEQDPAYSKVAMRCLRKKLFKEVTGVSLLHNNYKEQYKNAFFTAIMHGVSYGIFDPRLSQFDLEALSQSLHIDRDDNFEYMGLRTLYERYFVKHVGKYIELPQIFWMRVAMGLSFNEDNPTARAIEFYHLMSTMRYVPSTPTLMHSGLMRPQLSSCYLTTVEDDLHHIFKCIGDNAQLSKWSGGLANDWTNVRAIGANIKSIKVESQGVIPFLRIANDTTAAINRSGKRRSAAVVYLETWHLEIEDFLDLRRNTGDERRRTHDINTANWIPDLFMKRVLENENWTLFSPNDVPDLHHIW
jgi:ribonucleoside-diphosphate reductase alpha chain